MKTLSLTPARGIVDRKMVVGTLIVCLASSQVGCGPEVAATPVVVSLGQTLLAVTATVYGLQQVAEAHLDIERKRLQLKGMQDGCEVVRYYALSDDELVRCQRQGQVRVNGQLLTVASN